MPWVMQQAAIHMSLTGRGRPRRMAAADSRPGGGYRLVAGQYRDAGQPAGEFLAAALAPVADLRPLGQLSEGHEGDQRLAADQAASKRPGERAPVQQRGDIGVQDGRVHGGGSGQVAVTLGVGEGQELLQFLVGLEGIRGKLIERADRPSTLCGEQLADRQARTGRRLARVTVRAGCSHWYHSPKRCLPLMLGALGASHPTRISRRGKPRRRSPRT